MKLIAAIMLLSSVSAFANISCKGAVEYALQDGKALNEALIQDIQLPTVRIFKELQGLQYRVADVRSGCATVFDARDLFCRDFLKDTAKRFNLITDSERPFEEMKVLVDRNQEILNSIFKICLQQ